MIRVKKGIQVICSYYHEVEGGHQEVEPVSRHRTCCLLQQYVSTGHYEELKCLSSGKM